MKPWLHDPSSWLALAVGGEIVQPLNYLLAKFVQSDRSRCSQPPVDTRTHVVFYVNGRLGSMWMVTLHSSYLPRLTPRHLSALFSSLNTPPLSSSRLRGSPKNLKIFSPFRKGNIGLDLGLGSGFGCWGSVSSSDVESHAGDVAGPAMTALTMLDGLSFLVLPQKVLSSSNYSPRGCVFAAPTLSFSYNLFERKYKSIST